MKLEREIDEIITNFDDFMLSPMSIRELKDFFLFKANYAKGHKCALRYNLLLQCESVDTAFVKDLLNRVLVSYYLLPSEGIVGKRCVPFYRKPRTFDEICEQLNKLVGLQKVKLFSGISHNLLLYISQLTQEYVSTGRESSFEPGRNHQS